MSSYFVLDLVVPSLSPLFSPFVGILSSCIFGVGLRAWLRARTLNNISAKWFGQIFHEHENQPFGGKIEETLLK